MTTIREVVFTENECILSLVFPATDLGEVFVWNRLEAELGIDYPHVFVEDGPEPGFKTLKAYLARDRWVDLPI